MIETKRAASLAALTLCAAAFAIVHSSASHAQESNPAQKSASRDFKTFSFTLAAPAEVMATIAARCDACAWDVEGREAATFEISLDDRYVAHLPLVRSGRADYHVLLGPSSPGRHVVRVRLDETASARELRGTGTATIERVTFAPATTDNAEHTAISLAPILYARANTLGRFTDVPVFMWYEREPTARGTRYRYSAIFTNEDGGTPTDRLMATWGRTTDIEYVYSAEVDRAGKIIEDDLQGPDHKILAFAGKREGRHPLLWVSTDNNMVRDTGTTRVRYAPAPIAFPLDNVSREAVMDANPWLYEVAARELVREKKIAGGAPPGNGVIPDPRQFVYVEACAEVGNAALGIEIEARDAWSRSDRGVAQYKIVRDGCFRAAIPVGASVAPSDLQALRFVAYDRPATNGAPNAAASIRLDRVNKVFMLDDRYVPRASVLAWTGPATIVRAKPIEIPVK